MIYVYVYSIYDEKAVCYGQPFFQKTDGIAIRMFDDHVNDSSSLPFLHPSDFKLYRIGTFDELTALINSYTPVFLAVGNRHDSDNRVSAAEI